MEILATWIIGVLMVVVLTLGAIKATNANIDTDQDN